MLNDPVVIANIFSLLLGSVLKETKVWCIGQFPKEGAALGAARVGTAHFFFKVFKLFHMEALKLTATNDRQKETDQL